MDCDENNAVNISTLPSFLKMQCSIHFMRMKGRHNMAVQFGVSVPQGWTMDLVEITDPEEKYEAMTRAAKEADRLGYDSIWLFDHFHTVPTPELETTFECFTSLAGLDLDTQHV